MTRTRDAAISIFHAAAARDCSCGCGGQAKFDGGKVYDVALRALDAGWDESKHKRGAGGQFGAGTTVTKTEKYGQEIHDVHHDGKHLGNVREGMEYQKKANGKSTSAAPMVKRWSYDANNSEESRNSRGGKFIKGGSGHRSKKEAVASLKRAHDIHD